MAMYWADYFGDTMHLTTEEHGAYLLLIGTYWRRQKPLPDDDRWLASVTKLSTKKWKMVRPNIIEFFDILDGHLTNKRLEKEIVKSNNRSSQARTAGQRSGKQRARTLPQPQSQKEPSGSFERGAPTARSPPDDVDHFEIPDKLKRNGHANQGNRLPADWKPSTEDIAFATERGLDVADTAAQFRDWWISVAGAKGVKLDWPATWRTWVRRQLEFSRGNGPEPGSIVEIGARVAARMRGDEPVC